MRLQALITGDAPFDDAVRAGARAGGVGDAFLGGYQAALRALVPGAASEGVTCLAATEEGGAHPRAIATRLERDGDAWRLSGRKQWVTGAPAAARFLVVASIGVGTDGKNRLRVARVAASAPGVTLTPMPPPPFAPEVAHAQVAFDRVPVADGDLLPGDGYDRYLKPFRTVEDVHVHGALLGWIFAAGERAGWPREAMEELAALVAAARVVALADPSAYATHVILAGVLSLARGFLERAEPHWALVPEATRQGWQRDRALLQVASRARAQRAETAWARLAVQPAGTA